jgi:hypothetical protein
VLLPSRSLILFVLNVTRNFIRAGLKDAETRMKFCLRLRITASEMHEVLVTAVSDDAMGRAQTLEFFSGFKHWKDLVEDC